jgi:hypothetical protein
MSNLIEQIDEKIQKYNEDLSILRTEFMRKEQSIKLIIDKLNKHKRELLLEKPEDLQKLTGDLKKSYHYQYNYSSEPPILSTSMK